MWAPARRQSYASQKESSHQTPTLLAPWSWTLHLQNCETINFCCLNCSVCGILLWLPELANTNLLSWFNDPQKFEKTIMMEQTTGSGFMLSFTVAPNNSFQACVEVVCYDADSTLFGVHINSIHLKSSNILKIHLNFLELFFFHLAPTPVKVTTWLLLTCIKTVPFKFPELPLL